MNALKVIALILVIIGGLNWGLVGLLDFDVVAAIFGEMSDVSRVIYVVVGLAALVLAIASLVKPKRQQV